MVEMVFECGLSGGGHTAMPRPERTLHHVSTMINEIYEEVP
jgi:hypothetical protein